MGLSRATVPSAYIPLLLHLDTLHYGQIFIRNFMIGYFHGGGRKFPLSSMPAQREIRKCFKIELIEWLRHSAPHPQGRARTRQGSGNGEL